jgi:hypothetical protein
MEKFFDVSILDSLINAAECEADKIPATEPDKPMRSLDSLHQDQ